MKAVKQVLLVVFLVLVIIIMIQNAQPTTFKFLNWSYQVSQLLLVVIVLAIGFLTGILVAKFPHGKNEDDEPITPVRR
jgi:uncharacterized integral membrane protein